MNEDAAVRCPGGRPRAFRGFLSYAWNSFESGTPQRVRYYSLGRNDRGRLKILSWTVLKVGWERLNESNLSSAEPQLSAAKLSKVSIAVY